MDGAWRKPGPSSKSGTAEGIITRRLLDEMAGYLCLLPAAGWAMGIHNHGLERNKTGVQVDVHASMECKMNKHRKREMNASFRSQKSNIHSNLMEVDEYDNEQ
ncbi:hypothetical protein SAMN03159332_3297 [Paenibacillus sp. 276b]|nr:hypothetical protein SAMN03159332_3297 [Paenibacillus sp. 276b]